jgi:hypothetical protein
MKLAKLLAILLASALTAGCLEVDQHPGWLHGEYAGKRDNLAPQVNFHGDRLAWTAAETNRAQFQNEYNRAKE